MPGIATGFGDGVIVIPDASGELVATKVFPDVFHWIQFGSIRRQRYQNDVVWDRQFAAGLVPPGAVLDQGCDRARGDLGADLGQMQIGAFRVGCRSDDRCPYRAGWTDGTKDIGGVVTVIAHHRRTRTNGCPDIAERAFLPDPGFVFT